MGYTVDDNIIMKNTETGYGYMTDCDMREAVKASSSSNAVNKTKGANEAGYRYEKNDAVNTNAGTVMENFEEYIRDMQEKAKEAGEDEASKERESAENARKIAESLSAEEIKRLEMMGIDIANVRMSDIRGLVNTMRGNAHRAELKQMMAQISADNGDLDNIVVSGGDVKAAGTEVVLDGVEVSDIVAEKADLDAADNLRLSNSELIYLLRNGQSVNKDNLYKAHYSGSRLERAYDDVDDKAFAEMLPQIETIIEQAGYDFDDDSISGARLLIGNRLPVTTDTISAYMNYQKYNGMDIKELDDEFMTDAEIISDKADRLYDAVKEIKPETVYEMVLDKKPVTIASVLHYMRQSKYGAGAETTTAQDDVRAISAMRQMEEIRLRMTKEAAGRLVKLDLNIDTRELSKVVSELREYENKMIASSFDAAGIEVSADNIELYQILQERVYSVGEASAKILASPLDETEFTVNALYEIAQSEGDGTADTYNRNEQLIETVRRSYEAVGTAPRSDMGDSIKKAFANVDNILRELELPVNYENQRAVRILGYNSMEITKDNIASVVDYDRQVNMLLDSFYPEAVLGIIRDGINPLDMPIDELNNVIRARNYNEGVSDADNFAAFLRDLEKHNGISEAERESYIGIYRAMNKLAKSGDREAGWLFANGGRLTVRNLVAAMRSRSASGLDVSVDDDFGLLETLSTDGKKIDEQIEMAFEPTFESLSGQEPEMETQYNNKEISDLLEQNNIELTMLNMEAATHLLSHDGGIYKLVSDIMAKLKFRTGVKDDLIDSETENMTDSLLGEEIQAEFSEESILESLRGSEEMSLKYEDIRDRLTELMYQSGAYGMITSADISSIKLINAGFNILSRMARNDRYQVPVETENGIKLMNLTIRQGDAKGSIDISVYGEMMGAVNAEIYVNDTGGIRGFIVSSTSDGNYRLAEHGIGIAERLSKQGFDKTDIKYGEAGDNEKAEGFKGDTGMLYRAAVGMVKAIGEIIC